MSIVTLAYDYRDKKGRPHKADDVVNLPEQEAHNLVASGRARKGGTPAPTAANRGGKTTKEK